MKNKRIVYMGTTNFSAHILNELIKADYNIVALVSQPDRKVGRKQELKVTPTKEIALNHGIECFGFEDINNEIIQIENLKPDLIITCAYGQKVGSSILAIPKYQCINVHASLLPKYRGGAPIHYAIINGESKTGNTIMYMEEGLDTGAMLNQSEIEIDIKDTTSTLSDKLMIDGAKLLLKTLPMIFNNEIQPILQDEKLVSYSHNIERSFEFVDFNRDVYTVYNHMRGLIKVPGCYAYLNNRKIKFLNIFFEQVEHNNKCGLIEVADKEYFKIYCQAGFIKVYNFQIEGKKAIDFKDYLNGNKLEIATGVVMNEGVEYENRSK